MLRLDYQYNMQLSFAKPVNRHHFTLRCFPADNERQKITYQDINITPSYVGGEETDSFGNHCIYGLIEGEHTDFNVNVSGKAYVYGDVFLPVEPSHRIGMFRYHTGLTDMGPSLYEIYEKLPYKDDIRNDVQKVALQWMNIIYDSIKYVQGITQINTSAEEAAALSMGVCQDYVHIFLALLRHEHIPCRYVVGMMMGEGASHAWIEVSDGEKWIALDPTNNCPVDDRYINISHGRDAKDCTINQGFFYGLPEQLQEIHVVVEESSYD